MKIGKNGTIFFRLLYFFSFLCIISLVILGINLCTPETPNIQKQTQNAPKLNQFGFKSDSLSPQISTINKNETLSDILFNYDLGNHSVSDLVKAAKGIFDVRKLLPGKKYHVYIPDDSTDVVKYFVYEKDPINYVVFNLNDSINVYSGKKEITSKRKFKSAVIDQSLYVSLIEDDTSPELAIKLSKIFAWQIDFYHIQKGDNFKVTYEELYVDSQFVGIGKIYGAFFKHYNKDYYAFPIVQDSVRQFFDENGNSLRKAFLKAPLEFARISSRFSHNRLHPVLKVHRPHLGVDYAAPVGTQVRSTGDGVVIAAGYSSGNGNYVKIRHNSVYSTEYMHLSRFGKGIKNGTSVKQGQVIGYVGSTGLATGPHLDYRFFVNGKPVDPLKVELPPSVPLKDELRAEFERKKALILEELNQENQVQTSEIKTPA
jgi:murein DD-endopeptidase MepM/ murein hydrolase activator NlpD